MPELPEVETIRRDLECALQGQKTTSLAVFDDRLADAATARRWRTFVVGQRWDALQRKGKYLWVELSNGYRLYFHLRMTGQLILGDESPAKARMRFSFEGGKTLSFCDQRRFGEVWLLAPGVVWRRHNPLGPDALGELDCESFLRRLKETRVPVQPFLLDQRKLSGVGNIYAQEALFEAAIRPMRRSCRISRAEGQRLFTVLQQTLQRAIASRGSSLRNYRDAAGAAGSAQSWHAVYSKGGEPCVKCRSVLRAVKLSGRTSVYCPRCQK